jgi:hypothetical protein
VSTAVEFQASKAEQNQATDLIALS